MTGWLLLLAAAASAQAPEPEAAAMLARARPSIVKVVGVRGIGSGFVVDNEGRIATNAHVIDGLEPGDSLRIEHEPTRSQLPCVLLAFSKRHDIALLQLYEESRYVALEPLTLGDSDSVSVGEAVYAIGSPLNFSQSVSRGIISGLGERSPLLGYAGPLIQTDSSINPGNSGGPLVNGRGEAIGINTMKIQTTIAEGMGFAIPINRLKSLYRLFLRTGSIKPPSLGVVFKTKPAARDLAIDAVMPESGAWDAELVRGDVVIAIDGTFLPQGSHEAVRVLEEELERRSPDDKVKLTVLRKATLAEETVEVQLGPTK